MGASSGLWPVAPPLTQLAGWLTCLAASPGLPPRPRAEQLVEKTTLTDLILPPPHHSRHVMPCCMYRSRTFLSFRSWSSHVCTFGTVLRHQASGGELVKLRLNNQRPKNRYLPTFSCSQPTHTRKLKCPLHENLNRQLNFSTYLCAAFRSKILKRKYFSRKSNFNLV